MITTMSSEPVPLPVVLGIRRDLFDQYEKLVALHQASHQDALSVLVEFALTAYSQLSVEARNGELSDVLHQRLSLHDSLSHRCGVALAETERSLLLTEALAIECKRLLTRARESKQHREGGK